MTATLVSESIRARLAAVAEVTTFVGSTPARIFPLRRGQQTPLDKLPAITYFTVDDVDEGAMGAGPAFGPVRVQVSCWSSYYVEAERLALAVRRALRGWTDPAAGIDHVTFDGEGTRDMDVQTAVVHVPVDFLAWVNEVPA